MKRGQGIYREGYFKVSRRLLDSSLFCQPGDVIKVFVTLVALSQDPGGPRNGCVYIARKQLAARVFMAEERLEECLAILAGPDAESRTQSHDGRRIDVLSNGFRVLNYGLYHDEAKDRLLSLLRSDAGKAGGLQSGKARSRKRKTRSKTEANAKQNEATETETETRTETDTVVRTASPPSPNPWSREACQDWIDRFGGTAPGGVIGRHLKPLVSTHGWPEVRVSWRSYLAQAEAEFASAARFASTYGRWSGSAAPAQGARMSVLEAGIRGGMRGD